MIELLARMAGRRVLVLGDVMLDEYLWGDAARLSAEAPVPVVEVRRRSYAAGGAANVALNIASLGGTVKLAGVVGLDEHAGRLGELLRAKGVEIGGLVAVADRPTTTKTRLIACGQQVVRIDDECRLALPSAVEQGLAGWVENAVGHVDACVLSDYGKGVVTCALAKHLMAVARHAGRPVIVDPKGADYGRYRGATVIKPNRHEVERLLKEEIGTEAALLDAGGRLVAVLDGCAVLITRGADGMSLFRDGAASVHVPAVARNVFDVTGAGDTVIAVLAMLLACDAPLGEAVRVANLAAGVAVGKRGTAAVTLAEMREWLLERGAGQCL